MRVQHLLLLLLVASSSLCAIAQDDSVEAVAMETEPVKEAAKPAKKAKAPKATVLSVDDAEADVVSASGKKLAHKAAKFGATLLDRVSLDVGASLEVVFTPKTDGEASKPQQAMLMAVPASNPALAAYAVAKARKDGSHAATLSQAAVEKQLGPVGGKYAVTLLLGDPAAPKGVRWELGSATLAMSSEGGAASPAYKSALVQPMTNVLPNIAHIFRSPEKRPPAVVSLAFAGLAFAPLALLVLYLAATGGLALPNFPAGGGGLWALLFHGGIAALLGLYWLFWTRLNLAQTLPAALGVGAFTAAAGYKALSALADARLSQERAGATVAKKTN